MKEPWDDLGYNHSQPKRKNLRDQASRLEKMIKRGNELSTAGMNEERDDNGTGVGDYYIHDYIANENQNMRNMDVMSKNADSTGRDLDLHITATEQIPEERVELKGDSYEVCNDVPGRLPEFVAINTSPIVNWGLNGARQVITINIINDAYNEITASRSHMGKQDRFLLIS